MKLLIAFFLGIFVLAAHQQSKGVTLRFRWVLAGSFLLAASMYSMRAIS